MRVHVPDSLAAVRTGIEDHPVPAVRDAFRPGYQVCLCRDLVKQAVPRSGEGSETRIMLPRNHQDMHRSLRIDVTERNRTPTLAY